MAALISFAWVGYVCPVAVIGSIGRTGLGELEVLSPWLRALHSSLNKLKHMQLLKLEVLLSPCW